MVHPIRLVTLEAAAARSLSLARTAGSEWFSAYIRNQLGRIAAAQGRSGEAEAHFRASYAIREGFGDREGMAAALLGLGDVLAQREDWGAAEQQLHPASRSATSQRAERLLARAQEVLPADSFAVSVTRGRQTALETAIEQLLGMAPPAIGSGHTPHLIHVDISRGLVE